MLYVYLREAASQLTWPQLGNPSQARFELIHMWSCEEERKDGGEQSNSLLSWHRSLPPRRYLYDVNTM